MAKIAKPRAPQPPKGSEPRRRLSSAQAREAILVAAERRLLESGPDGIRLQEIGADVGLSHPTVLHHFGTRDGLVTAVVARAMLSLEQELLASFAQEEVDPEKAILRSVERLDEAMRLRGHARLLAWVALAKPDFEKHSILKELVKAIALARRARGDDAPFEDSVFGVLLTSSAMFGVAILGAGMLSMMGVEATEPVYARFRRWLTTLFVEHTAISSAPGSRRAATKARRARASDVEKPRGLRRSRRGK